MSCHFRNLIVPPLQKRLYIRRKIKIRCYVSLFRKLGSGPRKREPVRVTFHRHIHPWVARVKKRAGGVTWIKYQEWKIKRRRVTHITVAHMCKHGAPVRHSRERERLIHWKPRQFGCVQPPLEKSLFFSSILPPPLLFRARFLHSRSGVPRAKKRARK